jgi:hypothetical protein
LSALQSDNELRQIIEQTNFGAVNTMFKSWEISERGQLVSVLIDVDDVLRKNMRDDVFD